MIIAIASQKIAELSYDRPYIFLFVISFVCPAGSHFSAVPCSAGCLFSAVLRSAGSRFSVYPVVRDPTLVP